MGFNNVASDREADVQVAKAPNFTCSGIAAAVTIIFRRSKSACRYVLASGARGLTGTKSCSERGIALLIVPKTIGLCK